MKSLRVLLSISMLMVGITPAVVQAQNKQLQKSDKVIKAVAAKKDEELNKELKSVVQEALNGVVLTQKAYQLLDQNKADDAKDTIVKALGEIDAAISSNKGIDFLPIEANVQILAGVYDLPTAIGRRDAALEVLGLGDVQTARALLTPMVDEIDVEVVSLPIDTYKQKLNEAIGFLGNDKKWEARESLRMALSLAVVTVDVIPIPLIEAEAYIDDAIEAEKSDKGKAVELLKQANEALSLAAVLGYENKETKAVRDNVSKENKKLKKFKHQQLEDKVLKKVHNFEDSIKDGTSDMHKKINEQITKIKEKLSSK